MQQRDIQKLIDEARKQIIDIVSGKISKTDEREINNILKNLVELLSRQ